MLLAYLVIAGMLEYVFVYDDTRGTQLLILSLMLLVFAVNIPMLLAFSVARFQDPDDVSRRQGRRRRSRTRSPTSATARR